MDNDTFQPPKWTVAEIKKQIPEKFFVHQPIRAIAVLVRDITLAFVLGFGICVLRAIIWSYMTDGASWVSQCYVNMTIAALWLLYWWFQGLVFTGIWVIGHECAHESFLPSKVACNLIGLAMHTFLWTPHFGWKHVHNLHHRYHGLMEEDQHWIPNKRSELGHTLEDTPIVNLGKLIVQQLIGFPLYLMFHITGPRHYPAGTNHFNPFSLFYGRHRTSVLISDVFLIGIAYLTGRAVARWGGRDVFLFYGVPCLCVSHWVTMIVYLHHTDTLVPHYRRPAWNYTRGALATIDRDFLGWQGRFFLHDIAHFHIIHHIFPRMPFYHGEGATKHLKDLIGRDYRCVKTSVFKSLWETYVACQFVEDEGDILFYKDASCF